MNAKNTLKHPALLERDIQNGDRITLVGTERKWGATEHTVLRSGLEQNQSIERKEAWELPQAPVTEVKLNPDVCDVWKTTNAIARHFGIRVKAASKTWAGTWEKSDSTVWANGLRKGLRRAGYTFKHEISSLTIEGRRAIVIANKCFALKHPGKWLIKSRAKYWGGFDFSFCEETFDTVEQAFSECEKWNNAARNRSSIHSDKYFMVVKGGSSKVFA